MIPRSVLPFLPDAAKRFCEIVPFLERLQDADLAYRRDFEDATEYEAILPPGMTEARIDHPRKQLAQAPQKDLGFNPPRLSRRSYDNQST